MFLGGGITFHRVSAMGNVQVITMKIFGGDAGRMDARIVSCPKIVGVVL